MTTTTMRTRNKILINLFDFLAFFLSILCLVGWSCVCDSPPIFFVLKHTKKHNTTRLPLNCVNKEKKENTLIEARRLISITGEFPYSSLRLYFHLFLSLIYFEYSLSIAIYVFTLTLLNIWLCLSGLIQSKVKWSETEVIRILFLFIYSFLMEKEDNDDYCSYTLCLKISPKWFVSRFRLNWTSECVCVWVSDVPIPLVS